MKIVDMTPGLVHAVPASRWPGRFGGGYGRGGPSHVRDGYMAVPVLIERIGKFRTKREGACVIGIVEDNYTTTVVVRFPNLEAMIPDEEKRPNNIWHRMHRRGRLDSYDVASAQWPGYPEGIKLTSKKWVWSDEEKILNTNDIIMPWSGFLARREERIFVNDEVAMYQQRRQVLLDEITLIMNPLLAKTQHMGKGDMQIRSNPAGKQIDFTGDTMGFVRSFEGEIQFKQLPLPVRTKLRPLLDEIAAIDKKLACAV